MLTELRESVAAKLEAAGVKAHEYVGEALDPPCAAVVPAEPYVLTPAGAQGQPMPYRRVLVGIDVLLFVSREGGKAAAKAMDDLIEKAFIAFNDDDTYTIRSVSRPGVVTTSSGSKHLGSVLAIEELTQEPTEEP